MLKLLLRINVTKLLRYEFNETEFLPLKNIYYAYTSSAGVVLHVLIIHTNLVLTGLQTSHILNPLKDDLLVVLQKSCPQAHNRRHKPYTWALEVCILVEGDEVNLLKLLPDGLPHMECVCRPLQWWWYSRCLWLDFSDPTEVKVNHGQRTGGFFAQLKTFLAIFSRFSSIFWQLGPCLFYRSSNFVRSNFVP